MLWPLLPDSLSGLEVMDAVGLIIVWIRIIHESVKDINNLHDCELTLVQIQPILVLLPHKLYRLVCVHLSVSLLDDVLSGRVLIVSEAVTKSILGGLPIMELFKRHVLCWCQGLLHNCHGF